jgi:hypothetical protein
VSWDLRGADPEAVDLTPPGFRAPWNDPTRGPLVAPGRYTATLVVASPRGVRAISTPQEFDVRSVPNLPAGTDVVASAAFQAEVAELRRRVAATNAEVGRMRDELRHMRAAVIETPTAELALLTRIDSANVALTGFSWRLNGDPVRGGLDESDVPSISGNVFTAMNSWETRLPPTAMMRSGAARAATEIDALSRALEQFAGVTLAGLRTALSAARAPNPPGPRPPND